MRKVLDLIWGEWEQKYFSENQKKDSTPLSRNRPTGQITRDREMFALSPSLGGRYSGERARQPDFLTPYLKAILGTIGLHDLTFFSMEGSALGPDAVAEARTKTDPIDKTATA
jgi:FMN-dependent NADH-azoreductase